LSKLELKGSIPILNPMFLYDLIISMGSSAQRKKRANSKPKKHNSLAIWVGVAVVAIIGYLVFGTSSSSTQPEPTEAPLEVRSNDRVK